MNASSWPACPLEASPLLDVRLLPKLAPNMLMVIAHARAQRFEGSSRYRREMKWRDFKLSDAQDFLNLKESTIFLTLDTIFDLILDFFLDLE